MHQHTIKLDVHLLRNLSAYIVPRTDRIISMRRCGVFLIKPVAGWGAKLKAAAGGSKKIYDYVPRRNALSPNVKLAAQSRGRVDDAITFLRRCNDFREQIWFMDEFQILRRAFLKTAIDDIYFTQKKCSSWFRDQRYEKNQTIHDLASGKIEALTHGDMFSLSAIRLWRI